MVKYVPYSITDRPHLRPYYDYAPVMSYGCKIVAVVGARRIGKTFGAKRSAVSGFINRNIRFSWLRATDAACDKLRDGKGIKFFSDVRPTIKNLENAFINGENIYINGELAGYCMANSTFVNTKGSDYSNSFLTIFDEFISDRSEAHRGDRSEQFINMVYTIHSTSKNGRILMLANALNRYDPVLELLGVDINPKKFGFYINREKDLIVHYADDDPAFIEMQQASIVGRLIKGTRFEDNLVHNKFDGESDLYFDKLPAKLKELCCVFAKTAGIKIFYSKTDPNLYVRNCYEPSKYLQNYTVYMEDVNSTIDFIRPNITKMLLENFNIGRVLFENGKARQTFFEILRPSM